MIAHTHSSIRHHNSLADNREAEERAEAHTDRKEAAESQRNQNLISAGIVAESGPTKTNAPPKAKSAPYVNAQAILLACAEAHNKR